MAASPLRHLWSAIDMRLSEVLQADFWAGVVGLAAGITLALVAPASLLGATAAATSIIGVIVGAVIAGVSILAAFFDQAFLRKLRAINRDPVRYLAPFLFTTVLGVLSMLGLIALGAMTATTTPAVLATVGGVTLGLTVWAVASLLPLMATLVQFIRLKVDALDVADDIDIKPQRSATGTDG